MPTWRRPSTQPSRSTRSVITRSHMRTPSRPTPSSSTTSQTIPGRSRMADKVKKSNEGLDRDELEAQSGEQLPDREQMSLINANLAAPINAAVAANVLSDGSVAYANAEQANTITQSNVPPAPTGI